MYIEGCIGVKSLPDGLRCGELCIHHAGIRSLPNGLIVERKLSISNCADLQGLPDDMEIDEDVWISEMGIHELPKGFTVKGDLEIHDCPNLKALPEDLVVYGRTEITNTGR